MIHRSGEDSESLRAGSRSGDHGPAQKVPGRDRGDPWVAVEQLVSEEEKCNDDQYYHSDNIVSISDKH